MKVSIDINSLSQRLSKTIKANGMKILQQRAIKLIADIHRVAKDWKKEIRDKMKKPAISRGYLHAGSKFLNLHNSYSQNEGFPMRVSDDLRKSLHYRVTQRNNKDTILVTVHRAFKEEGFSPVGRYNSYGEYLNQEHPLLRGWKERTYEMLDERLRQL